MPGKYKQFSDFGQPSRLANFAAPLVVSLLLAGFAFAPALAADDDPTGSSNSTNGLSFTPGQSKAPDEPAPDLALATGDDDKNKDKADKADGAQIAQGSIRPASRKPLPGVVGTVKIRRPFKLFAQASNKEILIHNLTFRETPVREVISELARRGNLNIIIDKSCQGKITGELRDVTLDEAMDSVLAAAALTSRTLDNSTVVVASTQAMVQLGLNRPVARAFKLSYAHPFDVAGLLNASVFNRGYLPDFKSQTKRHTQVENVEEAASEKRSGWGSDLRGPTAEKYGGKNNDKDAQNYETDSTQTYSLETQPRSLRGITRSQTQEGVGFNNAAVDPGTQQIRASLEVNSDYPVDPNGGAAIVLPDVKNRQVIVVGTNEDVTIAEEAIRLIDRRPKQVHIQASLVELNNQGIRQLGATLNIQGEGLSSSIMGNSQAPLKSFLPGLGSTANAVNNPALPAIPFTGVNTTTVAPNGPGAGFNGLIGSLVPLTPPTIANVTALTTAQSAFNFLTANGAAGGRNNIATIPHALNLSVNMLLQTNKAKLVANPSIVVVDNTEALITIASEVVHKVTSTVSLGVVTTNVELTKAGIFLNVVPRVSEDGFISMRLRPQVSTPLGPPQVFGTTVVTLLNVRDIMSQEVRIKDGQTLVLGGLFTETEAAQLAKVPYLAEAPVLGALFRNTIKGRNRTELMLLITPKIVEEDPTTSLAERGTVPM
ncbi:MAG: type II secretion system protein GspD [Candidatus Obscuribacter sp.]|nr:type II secretion system protein GspD [Candidatus Obscuribacter sp.]